MDSLRAISSYNPKNPNVGLKVTPGSLYKLIRERGFKDGKCEKKIWFVQCADGKFGYVPKSCVKRTTADCNPIVPKRVYKVAEDDPQLQLKRGVAIYIYSSRPDGKVQGYTELRQSFPWFDSSLLQQPMTPMFHFVARVTETYISAFVEFGGMKVYQGEKLDVVQKPNPRQFNWFVRKCDGQMGFVPEEHLMEDLIEQNTVLGDSNYFHLIKSREVAEDYLKDSDPETFIVRESESDLGNLTIDIKGPDSKVVHMKIMVSEQGYKLDNLTEPVSTLTQLVEKFYDVPIYISNEVDLRLRLRKPLSKNFGKPTK